MKCLFLALNVQDVYFDDESAEVVISSLRLGDDQGRLVYKLFSLEKYITKNSYILLISSVGAYC